uniref:N-acetyltransferase domain-containing protein n=1 Tax=Panagrolaimus superbus TaxID=310955 RepID=A0A914XQ40_9BILA
MISYTIVSNPTKEKYWKRIYELVITAEKWFNTPNDYQIWRDGFGEDFTLFIAIDDETDEAIGSSCSTHYRAHDGSEFLTASGMLFVDPAYRGHKIGMALADKFSVGCPNRSLIAVPSMSKKYAKTYGYDKIPEDNMRDIEIKVDKINLYLTLSPLVNASVRSANEADWPKIFEYDRKMLKYVQRDKFIKLYCTQPHSYYKIAIDSSDNIVGVCLVRCNHEMKSIYTGPFYAETPEIAENLFLSAVKEIPDLSNFDEIRLAFYKTSPTLEMLKKFVNDEDLTNTHFHYIQFTKEIIQLPTSVLYSVTENDCCYI